jgi:hypothetical protein
MVATMLMKINELSESRGNGKIGPGVQIPATDSLENTSDEAISTKVRLICSADLLGAGDNRDASPGRHPKRPLLRLPHQR